MCSATSFTERRSSVYLRCVFHEAVTFTTKVDCKNHHQGTLYTEQILFILVNFIFKAIFIQTEKEKDWTCSDSNVNEAEMERLAKENDNGQQVCLEQQVRLLVVDFSSMHYRFTEDSKH